MPKYSQGRVRPGIFAPTVRSKLDGCVIISPKSTREASPPRPRPRPHPGFESSSETGAVDVGVEVASVFHLTLDVGLDDAPKFLLEARVSATWRSRPRSETRWSAAAEAPGGLVPSSRRIIRHGPVGFAGVSRAVLEVKALLKAVDGLEFGLEGNVVTAGVLVERGLPTWTGGRRGEARGLGIVGGGAGGPCGRARGVGCPSERGERGPSGRRESVGVARVPSGGMILAMPALAPSGVMLLMYAKGSRNCSGVGRNVGHSGTAVLLVRRCSLTLAWMARWSSAALKSPAPTSSLEGGRVRRFARPSEGGTTPWFGRAPSD